ncbi:MAG TPA: flagellar basal body-associated FliL family protein [bacterium]
MAEQGDKGPKRLLNLLVLLSAVTVLGMVALALGMFMLWGSKAQPKEAKIIEEKPEPGKIYDLGTFIVNLADEEASRYVRADVQLEFSKVNMELDKEIKERDAQFKDLVNTLLNDRKAVELSTSEGKEAFRRELLLKINQSLKFGAVTNVFLTQFAIQ